MDYPFDTLPGTLIAGVFFGMMGFGLVVLAQTFARDMRRRRELRQLAETRQWRFLGYLASDHRDPYTRFEEVSWAVLLRNVVEGREREFDFSLIEYCVTPRHWNTGALVQLDVAPVACRIEFCRSGGGSSVRGMEQATTKIGLRAAAALRKIGALLDSHSMNGLIVQIDSGALLVRALRSPLEAQESLSLLEAAFSLSTAVVDDERAARATRDGARRQG